MSSPITLKVNMSRPITAPVIRDVIVVGCGGTGSYIIPHLARLVRQRVAAGKTLNLFLADGDVVEEKNLIRQNFISSDIGRNKAQVMAERYSAAFGITINYSNKYLETTAQLQRQISGVPLVVSCVDNLKSRKLLTDTLTQFMHAFLVDCGNEEKVGQVIMTAIVGQGCESPTLYRTPHIFELYPALAADLANSKFASEMSCAELAESSPQYGFVNLTAATIALNYILDLLNQNPIKTYLTDFSIENKFSSRSLTHEAFANNFKHEGNK